MFVIFGHKLCHNSSLARRHRHKLRHNFPSAFATTTKKTSGSCRRHHRHNFPSTLATSCATATNPDPDGIGVNLQSGSSHTKSKSDSAAFVSRTSVLHNHPIMTSRTP